MAAGLYLSVDESCWPTTINWGLGLGYLVATVAQLIAWFTGDIAGIKMRLYVFVGYVVTTAVLTAVFWLMSDVDGIGDDCAEQDTPEIDDIDGACGPPSPVEALG